ncbi:MAG: hypothetical protein ACOVPA_18380 [Rubrivivax sp.]
MLALLEAQCKGCLGEGIQSVVGLAGLACGAHVRGHAGQHFGRADGLGDVVDAAGIEGPQHVGGVGQAGHEDEGVRAVSGPAFSRCATSKPPSPRVSRLIRDAGMG